MLNPIIGGYGMPTFRGENFHRWLQNCEIHECFLPRKVCAIRYVNVVVHVAELLQDSMCHIWDYQIILSVDWVSFVSRDLLSSFEDLPFQKLSVNSATSIDWLCKIGIPSLTGSAFICCNLLNVLVGFSKECSTETTAYYITIICNYQENWSYWRGGCARTTLSLAVWRAKLEKSVKVRHNAHTNTHS